MAQLHMNPNSLAYQHAGTKAFMRMFDQSCQPQDLLLLSKADHMGRIDPPDYQEMENSIRQQLSIYEERMARPYVQGRDLVAAGMKPGPAFSDVLRYAHKMRLAGVPKEDALPQAIAYMHSIQ